MRRRLFLTAAILAACLFSVPAYADCPPGDPDCPLDPPQSEEVNPDPEVSGTWVAGHGGQQGSAGPVLMAMPLPRVVPVRAGQGARPPAPVVSLPVPMRYQDSADASDMSCGLQALGMALDGLGGPAPTSASMTDLLNRAGMLYEYGTGVEELAFAAQSFGYAGSLPFHGATLDDLRAQLDLGRPVVVALGTSGEGQPGHFVTVTGLSADRQWVSFNDPALGPQTLPIDEFLRLWEMQGNSGVIVAQEPPLAPDGAPVDAMPWVVLMAGVMALVSTTPLAVRRKGIGGHASPPGTAGEWVWKQVPVYKTVTVQDGMKNALVEVPRFRTVREEVVEIVEERVAVTRTVRKQDGWITTLERQPVFGTERYVSGYRTVTRRVPEYITIGKRKKLVGYDTRTYREPVYATRTVVTGWREVERRTPQMVLVEEFDHWQLEPREVRRWVERQVPSGFDKIVQVVPNMVERQVQVGTEGKWVWEEDSDVPQPVTVLADITPPEIIRWDTRLLRFVRGVSRSADAEALVLRELEGGYVSVTAPAAVRRLFNLPGKRYLPETVAKATGGSFVRSALSKGSLFIAALAAGGTNLYEYGLGEHKDEGIGSQGFWVSTGVDLGLSVLTGVIAAGIGAIAIGVGALTAPAALIAVALLGIAIALVVEARAVPELIKDSTNTFVDDRERELEMLESAPQQMVAPKGPPTPLPVQ